MNHHRRALTFLLLIMLTLPVASVQAQLYPEPILVGESLPGDPQVLVDWMNVLYDQVEAERVSAPGGSRLYGYAGIAAYEALVPFMPGNRSLVNQVNELTDLPWIDYELQYDPITVVNAAMQTVLNNLFRTNSDESRAAFVALRDEWLQNRRDAGIEHEVMQTSVEYGELVGKGLNDWINSDGLLDIRLRDPYVMPAESPDAYVLTGEALQPAEPYWGDLRPFIVPYTTTCWQMPNWEYSEDENSVFYQQALEVFDVGNDLTEEQRNIAEWWVDTPALTGTPAGHWVQIENQMVDELELDLGRAAEMYAMVGMVLADSFIVTWDLKYNLNLLRPETYINLHISDRWRPYIETPPFPEYPSGHSVVSAAAADMLTALFGTVHFVDRLHEPEGETPREFWSFEQAANEAAISRLYGGIHYRSAIENGMRQGQCIAETALQNVIMRPVSQGE
jgi:hypothetical protein